MTVKLGGEPLLTVLIKGNQDLLDVIAGPHDGGTRLQAGLSERIRQDYAGRSDMRVEHEPRGDVASLRGEVESQQGAIFALNPDIVLLSTHPDVLPGIGTDKPDLYTGFVEVVRAIKGRGSHVIFVNASTIDPRNLVSNYAHMDEPFTRRAQRFNLLLLRLSTDEGISIIDVDRLIAERGAGSSVSGPLTYSDEACEAICLEALRIIDDYGFFDRRPVLEQVGRSGT